MNTPYIEHHPHFILDDVGQQMLQHFIQNTPWNQHLFTFNQKEVPMPRMTAWYGEKTYQYSGIHNLPLSWTPELLALKSQVEQATQHQFNCALLNYYRNGTDSISWHSDDEKELGPNPTIASLSFGTTRKFLLKSHDKKINHTLLINNGDLVVMKENCQSDFKHSIPKEPDIQDPRINITFRRIE